MIWGTIFCVAGLAGLAYTSDKFVAAAGSIAEHFKISPVIIGAVIVGFGTSAPEMAVSGLAAGRGDSDLGVGNVVGSNVANVSLVLGVSALVAAVPISRSLLRRELALSVASVALFGWFVQNGISKLEGAILLLLLLGLIAALLVKERHTLFERTVAASDASKIRPRLSRKTIFWLIIGLGGTIASAQFLVEGAQLIAKSLNLGSGFVGLTLIAVGTSLPELVTAVAASRRKMNELIIGNILGSNIFNSLAVGGLVGIVGDGRLVDGKLAGAATLTMLICMLAMTVFVASGRKVSKLEAAVLIAVWVVSLPFVI